MKDQRLVLAFARTVFGDVLAQRSRLARREKELAGWVAELTPENAQIFDRWMRRQQNSGST